MNKIVDYVKVEDIRNLAEQRPEYAELIKSLLAELNIRHFTTFTASAHTFTEWGFGENKVEQ